MTGQGPGDPGWELYRLQSELLIVVDEVVSSSARVALCAGALIATGVRVQFLETPHTAEAFAADLQRGRTPVRIGNAHGVRLASGEPLTRETIEAEKAARAATHTRPYKSIGDRDSALANPFVWLALVIAVWMLLSYLEII